MEFENSFFFFAWALKLVDGLGEKMPLPTGHLTGQAAWRDEM